jgi:iron complex transport system substrate-binding protein
VRRAPGFLAATLLLVLGVCGPAVGGEAPPGAGRTVADSAGRTVRLPARVERVYAAGHPAVVLLYTLAPDRLLGWTRQPTEEEKTFLLPATRGLPEYGRLTGRGDTANVEVVLGAKPDLILDYGSVTPTFASLADRVQRQTGIPYMLVDGAFDRIPQAYRILGDVLGVPERAERLAAYAERAFAGLRATLARVPAAARPRVYYARGNDGLDTGLPGAINVELLDLVGARNVAEEAGRGRLASVSLEQVLLWNPEVVLTLDWVFFADVARRPEWGGIDAVREGRVYMVPRLPFPWFDRPPSVNRLIGVRWLLHLLYPGIAGGDLREAAREFYALFYQRPLSDAEATRLLDGALPVRR